MYENVRRWTLSRYRTGWSIDCGRKGLIAWGMLMNELSNDATTSVLPVVPSTVQTAPIIQIAESTQNVSTQTTVPLESVELVEPAKSTKTQTMTAVPTVPASEKSVREEDSMHSWLLFSLFLGCGALAMFWSVWRTWKYQQQTCNQKKELHYYQGVFLRRIQSAAMLALIAILLPLGPIFFLKSLVGKIVFLIAILLLIFWMVMLALADMLVARFHWQRLQDQCKLERLKLEWAIRQQRATDAEQTKESSRDTTDADKPIDSDISTGSVKPSPSLPSSDATVDSIDPSKKPSS